MEPLNLPKADLRIAKQDERTMVYDLLRRKYVALTDRKSVV